MGVSPAPKEVRIPVPTPCLTQSDLPPSPPFVTDAELTKADDFAFVIMLYKDRIERQGYELILEATLQACVK